MKTEGNERRASIYPLVVISALGILAAASAGFLIGPGLGPKGTAPTSPNSATNGFSPANSGYQNTMPRCHDPAAVVTGFDPITGAACYTVPP